MTLSHIPKRTTIPRDTGLTMMMDKGLSTRQMEDFLSTSASYTDIIKFGFGTSIVSNNIQEKIALMKQDLMVMKQYNLPMSPAPLPLFKL